MPPRPSPSESATLYAVGTNRRGNDGRTYIVAQTAAGVRRWRPVVVPSAHAANAAKPSFKVMRRVYIIDNGGTSVFVFGACHASN